MDWIKTKMPKRIPSKELTYPPQNGIFEDDFPLPKVGYVSSLGGITFTNAMGLFCFTFPWLHLGVQPVSRWNASEIYKVPSSVWASWPVSQSP